MTIPAPDYLPKRLATRGLIILGPRPTGVYSKDDIPTSFSIEPACASPTALTGLAPGSLAPGTAGTLGVAGEDGVPVLVAKSTDITGLQEDVVDINLQLTALDAAYDVLVKATVACPSPAAGVNTASLTVQLKDMAGNNIAAARQILVQAAGVLYNSGPGPGNASLSMAATTGAIIATPVAGGLWLCQTNASGLFAGTLTNTDDEAVAGISALTAVGGVSVADEACVVVGSNAVAVTWSA